MKYFYSAQNNGFYLPEVHGDEIPADVVEITAEEHAALMAGQASGKVIVVGKNGKPALAYPEPVKAEAPRSVSMRQARLALLEAGLLEQTEDFINSLPETQRNAALISWEYAQTVDRDDELVQQLITALRLDDVAADELFMRAAGM